MIATSRDLPPRPAARRCRRMRYLSGAISTEGERVTPVLRLCVVIGVNETFSLSERPASDLTVRPRRHEFIVDAGQGEDLDGTRVLHLLRKVSLITFLTSSGISSSCSAMCSPVIDESDW